MMLVLDDDDVGGNEDVGENMMAVASQTESYSDGQTEKSNKEDLFKTCMNESEFRDLAITYITDKDLKELGKQRLADANLEELVGSTVVRSPA